MVIFGKMPIFTRMKKYLYGIVFSLCGFWGQAQINEFGIGAYSALYRGDLMQDYGDAPSSSAYMNYLVSNLGGAGSLQLKSNIDNRQSIRFGLTFAQISGADSRSMSGKNGIPRINRNLSFNSDILEFSTLYDYNLRPFGLDKGEHRFTPYVFGGLSVFHFNPKTTYQGKVYELQPLHTEGQNLINYPQKSSYSLTTLALPIGAGLRFAITDHIRFDLELGYRFTTTDYLDDVSGTYADNDVLRASLGNTAAALADRRIEKNIPAVAEGTPRGSAKYKDGYLLLGINLRYVIFENPCAAFR